MQERLNHDDQGVLMKNLFSESLPMPNIMIRKDSSGQMTCYIAKKDLEEKIIAIEHDTPDCWGGELTLADGSKYFLAPLSSPPNLPITLRAKRAGED